MSLVAVISKVACSPGNLASCKVVVGVMSGYKDKIKGC